MAKKKSKKSAAKKTKKKAKKKTARKKPSSDHTAAGEPGIPNDVLRDISKLVTEWRKIVRQGRRHSYESAKFMAGLLARLLENEKLFQSVLVGSLKEPKGSLKGHLTQATAYSTLSDEAIWRGVGREGITAIMGAELNARQRSSAVRKLLKIAAENNGVIPRGLLTAALAKAGIVTKRKRGPSVAELERNMLVDQINEAVSDDLLSRGLLRQIFTEEALKVLTTRAKKAAGAA